MKLPFNWKKKQGTDSVPAEINDYYQAEQRDKRWLTWALTAGTFLVTVLIVLGLFAGGRWVYRKVANNDKSTNTSAEQKLQDDKQKASNNRPGQTGTSSTSTNQPSGGVAGSSTTPTPSSPNPTPAANNTVPQTGGGSEQLPRTGPDSTEE